MPTLPSRSPFDRHRLRPAAFGSMLIVHLAFASIAVAQETSTSEEYEADFFAPVSPQTALDMVQYLPGFRFDSGDESVRGFSEAGGNVLIDGERPATKSGGLKAALSAIPARQVARIEIVRNGTTAIGTSEQSVLANIIRLGGRKSLAIRAGLSRMEDRMAGSASLSATGTIGDFSLSSLTSFENDGERSHGDRISLDRSGNRTGLNDLTYETDFPELSERLTLDGRLAGGQFTANAMLAYASLAETFAFSDGIAATRYPKDTKRWRGEISTDWACGIGGDLTLKLLGLTRYTDLESNSLSQTKASNSTLQVTDRFENESLLRETIARFTLATDGGTEWQPQIGAEAAWNTLDSHSALTEYANGAPAFAHPTVETRVSESRLDAFASVTWRPAPNWMVDAGISYEISRIKARSDTTSKNSFGFVKPRITISFKPDNRNDLRLSLRRTVGQLAFGDFAASANLAEGKSSNGNPNLGPDQITRTSFAYDWHFGKRGTFNLSAFYDWRQDALEAAVLPAGAFGVVNAGDARVWNVAANLEFPTGPYVPGGLFKFAYARFWSRATDPVTGTRRRLNAVQPVEFQASFRQDLSRSGISWGLEYAGSFRNQYWFADELREQRHHQELRIFVETNKMLDAKIRLEINGLTGIRNIYHRQLYVSDRSGSLCCREVWDIRTPARIALSLSRNY